MRVHATFLGVAAATAAVAGCATKQGGEPGEFLFFESTLPGGPGNTLQCAFCHTLGGRPADDAVRPGSALDGVASRGSWWNGAAADLAAAVNACRTAYMRAVLPATGDNRGRSLARWLAARGGQSDPVSIRTDYPPDPDVVVARGDPAAGEAIYGRACSRCHGEVGDGDAGQPVPAAADLLGGLRHAGYDDVPSERCPCDDPAPGPCPTEPGEDRFACKPEWRADCGSCYQCCTPNYRMRWQHFFRYLRVPDVIAGEFTPVGEAGMIMPFFGETILSDAQIADVFEYLCGEDAECAADADALEPR